MLSYTTYTTIDPASVLPMINVEERGRRPHNNTNTSSTSTPSSTYASDEEDDHIEPLKSSSRRNSILNFCYGLPTSSSSPNSRSNSRTRSRSRSRPNIKVQDVSDAAAILYSLSTKAPVMASSPKQSANNSRRSSVELRGEYAELLEERSRPSSRVNSRANSRASSRVREPTHHHPHPHPHLNDYEQDYTHLTVNIDTKKEKEHCGSDCSTCGNCNTIKDTVLELDESNTPSKIQKPRRKSHEITGPYDSSIDNDADNKEEEEVSPVPALCSSDSIESKLGFDMSLLSF